MDIIDYRGLARPRPPTPQAKENENYFRNIKLISILGSLVIDRGAHHI